MILLILFIVITCIIIIIIIIIIIVIIIIIKSPRSGVTLCFQFVSAASAAAAANFAAHVKTITAKPYIFGTKNIWVWGNVLVDLSMTLTQGHCCGID